MYGSPLIKEEKKVAAVPRHPRTTVSHRLSVPWPEKAGPSTQLSLLLSLRFAPRPLAEYCCEQQGFALQSERADASQNHFFPWDDTVSPQMLGSIRGEGCVGRSLPVVTGEVVHFDPTQRQGDCAYASHSAKKAQEGSLVTLLPVSKDTETCKMGCKLGTTPLVEYSSPTPRAPRH